MPLEDESTKWICQSCGYEWVEDPFITCGNCPDCLSEYVEHQ